MGKKKEKEENLTLDEIKFFIDGIPLDVDWRPFES